MRATVVITHLNDPRLSDAIESALQQGPTLSEILVADGGSSASVLQPIKRRFDMPRIRFLELPGSVAESRNAALPLVKSEILVFLDADQCAPAGWLDRLTEPIRTGQADFTGGPTRPPKPASSSAEAYTNKAEARLYEQHVPHDLTLLPMGNSAWRTETLRRVGGFDPRLRWGGEDYDVNLRALRGGARGRFVADAWVYHDQSHLDTFRKVLRRKSKYYFGAATAYLKDRSLGMRSRASAARFRIHHPVDLLDLVLKPVALYRAHRYFRRVFVTSR